MNKILKINAAIKLAKQLREQGKTIVLAGGCFDILHIGHIVFLQAAKKYGDVLFVLLENDEVIHLTKGGNRPINIQKNRAIVLSSLRFVDYVVLLSKFTKDRQYDTLVNKIKPAIIATTKGDPAKHHKERQAKIIDAKVIDVIERMQDVSTSRLATLLKESSV